MADNLTIPVATNEIGGFHYQKMKIVDGTDASTVALAVDATYGAAVDVKRGLHIKAEDAAHVSGDNGVMALVVRKDTAGTLAGTDGDYAPLQVDASGSLRVVPVGGIAHDSADSGEPVKVGAKARATLSDVTLVAANDRTDLYADLDGVLLSRPAPHGDLVNGNATNTDGTSTQCIAAQGAGVKVALTDVTLCNTSATAITVDLKDGTTVKWSFPVPAGGGVVFAFRSPLVGTANTAWNFDPSAAATTITCSMSGYKTKV